MRILKLRHVNDYQTQYLYPDLFKALLYNSDKIIMYTNNKIYVWQ